MRPIDVTPFPLPANLSLTRSHFRLKPFFLLLFVPCLLFIAKSLFVQKCFQLGFLSCSLSRFIRSAILLWPEYFFIDMPQAEATEKKEWDCLLADTPLMAQSAFPVPAPQVLNSCCYFTFHTCLPFSLSLALSRSALICILFQLFCIFPLFFFVAAASFANF